MSKEEVVSKFLLSKLSSGKVSKLYELLTDKETRIIGDTIINDTSHNPPISMTIGIYVSGMLYDGEYDSKIANSPYIS